MPGPGRELSRIVSSIRSRMPTARGKSVASSLNVPSTIDLDSLTSRIILPTLSISDEEIARGTHQDNGQKLARQDRWQDLSRLIRYADDSRLSTPGGECASLLLAYGARSDIVAATEDALHDNAEPDLSGINSLGEVIDEFPGDYACAMVVALAHIDIGWAWRVTHGTGGANLEHERHSNMHFRRARELLAPFEAMELDSPSLAAANCALKAAQPEFRKHLTVDYETLIDLDPDSPRHMRTFGQHLLSIHKRDFHELEIEARRTAARTGDIWGAGAYAWVYLDALALDRQALDLLDAEFFAEGLSDILQRRTDQHIVNLLAAFCAITMAPPPEDEPDLYPRAEATRVMLHNCLDWILSDHLRELHPVVWSQTLISPGKLTLLPSRRALVDKGRRTALRIIAAKYASEIADGGSITFSPNGVRCLPSA